MRYFALILLFTFHLQAKAQIEYLESIDYLIIYPTEIENINSSIIQVFEEEYFTQIKQLENNILEADFERSKSLNRDLSSFIHCYAEWEELSKIDQTSSLLANYQEESCYQVLDIFDNEIFEFEIQEQEETSHFLYTIPVKETTNSSKFVRQLIPGCNDTEDLSCWVACLVETNTFDIDINETSYVLPSLPVNLTYDKPNKRLLFSEYLSKGFKVVNLETNSPLVVKEWSEIDCQ